MLEVVYNMQFEEFRKNNLDNFEKYLLSHIDNESGTELETAMLYSLDAPGKRLRPLLLLATLQSFAIPIQTGYPAAAALEMVHTYSLIHDDLPAMDDDRLRRGRPTSHIQFNEATAILAGDALLTLAFEVLTRGGLSADVKVQLIELLANTAGYKGMVGGQQADVEGEQAVLTLEEVESIHQRKTGALLKTSLLSAGIIAEKSSLILDRLAEIATEIGLAYQIRDDILDVVGNEKVLGKETATDVELEKSTYPALLGLEGSFKALDDHLGTALKKVQLIVELEPSFDEELLFSFVNQLSLEEYK